MYDITGVVGLIKTKAIILTRLLAVLAAGFLVVPLCADCKDRCSRLLGASCHIDKIQEKPDSACCHHITPQPKNSLSGKCKGACSINNLPPSATTQDKIVGPYIQIASNIYESPTIGQSGVPLKIAISSVNQYYSLHNSTQSILCVFVI